MFNPLKQLGDLKQLQKQAASLQKQLAAEEVVVEGRGVKVVVSGDQKIKELVFLTSSPSSEEVKKTINKAFSRVQKLAARKLIGGI